MLLRTHIWVHCLRRLMCNPQHFRSPAASGFNRSALSLHVTYLFDWVCLCLPAHYPNLSFNVEGGCEWLWHGGRCVETRSGTQRVTPALGGCPQPCRVTVSLRRKGKPSVNGRGNMSNEPHASPTDFCLVAELLSLWKWTNIFLSAFKIYVIKTCRAMRVI